jgi:DNA-binding NarL/FixJ family response regulator
MGFLDWFGSAKNKKSMPASESIAPDPAAERDRFFAERKLTSREKEIAALIFQGLSSREIVEALHVSENTVNSHIRHLLAKCGVAGRKKLLIKFIK